MHNAASGHFNECGKSDSRKYFCLFEFHDLLFSQYAIYYAIGIRAQVIKRFLKI